MSVVKATLPQGVDRLESGADGSAGLRRALDLARQIETDVKADLRAAREHVTKQLSRSVSTLSNESSLVKTLFKAERRKTFDKVHAQALDHYQDRIGRVDEVGEIFRTRDKSMVAAVVAGFKAEPAALGQPAHPLWKLRDLIAPGLERDAVAAKLD